MRRRACVLWAVCAVAAGLTFPVAEARPLVLEARPISVGAPGGGADVLRAYALSPAQPEPWFGGLSGLEWLGDELVAVTDKGAVIAMTVSRGRDGGVDGFGPARIEPLLDRQGRSLIGRLGADAEGLARHPAGLVVSFERRHRLALLRSIGAPLSLLPTMLPTGEFSQNGGMEALGLTRSGTLLAILEAPPFGADRRDVVGWRVSGVRPTAFRLDRTGGFSPTGLDVAEDGSAYLLERRLATPVGWRARIRRFAPDVVDQDDWGAGELVFSLRGLFTPDNLEGIAIDRAEDGGVVATMISDDNGNGLQRTLLIQARIGGAR